MVSFKLFGQNLHMFNHLFSGIHLFLKATKDIALVKSGQGLETVIHVFRIYFTKQIIHVCLCLDISILVEIILRANAIFGKPVSSIPYVP